MVEDTMCLSLHMWCACQESRSVLNEAEQESPNLSSDDRRRSHESHAKRLEPDTIAEAVVKPWSRERWTQIEGRIEGRRQANFKNPAYPHLPGEMTMGRNLTWAAWVSRAIVGLVLLASEHFEGLHVRLHTWGTKDDWTRAGGDT
jgi:hypothetical protein